LVRSRIRLCKSCARGCRPGHTLATRAPIGAEGVQGDVQVGSRELRSLDRSNTPSAESWGFGSPVHIVARIDGRRLISPLFCFLTDSHVFCSIIKATSSATRPHFLHPWRVSACARVRFRALSKPLSGLCSNSSSRVITKI
jgi:hypothetical protein